MDQPAQTPSPPYYAVIFTSTLSDNTDGYAEMAERMLELAGKEPGFLGIESAREGVGITVSYWSDLASIQHWKANLEHLAAQRKGAHQWYASYTTRICLVERDYTRHNGALTH